MSPARNITPSLGEAAEPDKGPHNGRLLKDGDFAVEMTIFEDGQEPQFRVYPTKDDKPIDPRAFEKNTLAALGMLNPVIAGAAMAMSSVSVVSNALLLKRWKAGNT